jgi:hypothetical protein
MLYLHGRPLWFRRINSVERFKEVLSYAATAAAGVGATPPAPLASRSFSWTGGGLGPHPPILD